MAERTKRTERTPRDVRFRELDRDESMALLARNDVGRLAYSLRDQVDIVTVHYVLDGDWLFGRTSPGPKLEKLQRNWWVAFEVDEIDGPLDWRSVVVRGGFYPLSPEAGPEREELYDEALAAMRAKVPVLFTKDDPVAFRTVVFAIAVQEMSGRAATTSTDASDA